MERRIYIKLIDYFSISNQIHHVTVSQLRKECFIASIE